MRIATLAAGIVVGAALGAVVPLMAQHPYVTLVPDGLYLIPTGAYVDIACANETSMPTTVGGKPLPDNPNHMTRTFRCY